MSLKSILRSLGLARPYSGSQSLGDAVQGVTPHATPFLDRLTSRSDWNNPHAAAQTTAARQLWDNATAPTVAPWDRLEPISTDGHGVDLSGHGPSDPWPATDDPYVDPEPCNVVEDEGLSAIRNYSKLAERGLTGRLENLKIVGDILDLVERQDAAEKKLIEMGYIWNVKLKNWILPLA